MKTRSTYGLRLDQMDSLFSMGAEEPDPTDDKRDVEKMAGLLREQLMSALPTRSLLFDALVMMMEQHGCDTQPLAGRPLGQVLLSPDSDVGTLRAIKESSKTLSCTLDSQTEAALATTTYYAAIASCLVHHDTKITQSSYEKLDESFSLLIENAWMAQELAALFSRARRICRDRQGSREG